ncbi:hypothetical protein BM526_12820 [Alteromonas mediterranea]|uniref:VanZ family protein n=1 Tax=Alteromonas mediterranea TaxID=314275 RepID=UPI000903ED02|nr:VanZ family protein [Alteromonas mediterranea]APE02654.1 hypothetical protein BM526_12820 [Alteromonas mediterranea]
MCINKLIFLLLTIVAAVLLFFLETQPYSHRLFIQLWNLGHAALFFVGTFAFLIIRRREGVQSKLALLVLSVTVLALLTEALQMLAPTRSFSLIDIINDLIGAGLAITLFRYITKKISISKVMIISSVCIITLGSLTSNFFLYVYDEWQMHQDFPKIANFENRQELTRWSGDIARTDTYVADGHYSSLQVNLSNKKYSGATLHHLPNNWQNFDKLMFSIWVEQTTMLTLRIHDKYHVALDNPQRNQYQDRFNQAISLQQGWNHLSISIQQIKSGPAKRSLDVSNIKSIGIFSTEPHDTDVFIIDSMVLK